MPSDTPSDVLRRPAASGTSEETQPAVDSGATPAPEIVVTAYDPQWPGLYAAEAAAITAALRHRVRETHHIGSTAVPGLAAKPVIDVLVVVGELENAAVYRNLLEPLAYVYQDVGDPGRHFYRKVPRVRHVHIAEHGGVHYWRFLLFRDRLRSDSRIAGAYEALKRGLAELHANDRDSYTRSKTEFVEAIVTEEVMVRPDLEAHLRALGWRAPGEAGPEAD